MGIETKYFCDNCKEEVIPTREYSAPDQLYVIHVSVKRMHMQNSILRDVQHWCRACCDRLGLFHKLTPVNEVPATPAPTLEYALREYISNMGDDAVVDSINKRL
jgi:hypothetical protein